MNVCVCSKPSISFGCQTIHEIMTPKAKTSQRSYEQRGHYLKLLQYLYCLLSMSPDVTNILSKMQNIFLKSVQLVGMVAACEPGFVGAPVCILFYLCMIRRVVIVYD